MFPPDFVLSNGTGVDITGFKGPASAGGEVGGAEAGKWQGLTLVHFSAQPEPFLTQDIP